MSFQIFCYHCGKSAWAESPTQADFLEFIHKDTNPTHKVYVSEYQLEVA